MKKTIKTSKKRNLLNNINTDNLIYLFILFCPIYDVFLYFFKNQNLKILNNLPLILMSLILIIDILKKNNSEKDEYKNIKIITIFTIIILFLFKNFKNILEYNNAIFLLICLNLMYSEFKEKRTEKLSLAINYSGFIYLFFTIFAMLTNTGNFYINKITFRKSYFGWFDNIDEVGLLFMMFLPFLVNFLKNKREQTLIYLEIAGIFIYLSIIIYQKKFLVSSVSFFLIYVIFKFIEKKLDNKLKRELYNDVKPSKNNFKNIYENFLNKIIKKENKDEKNTKLIKIIINSLTVLLIIFVSYKFLKIDINILNFMFILTLYLFLLYNIKNVKKYTKFLKADYMILLSSYIYSTIFLLKINNINMCILILLNTIYIIKIINIVNKLKIREERFEEYKYNLINKNINKKIEKDKKNTKDLKRRVELEQTREIHEILDRTQNIYLANYLENKNKKNILLILKDLNEIDEDINFINLLEDLNDNINFNLVLLNSNLNSKKIKEKYFKNRKINIYALNKFKVKMIYIFSKLNIFFNIFNIRRKIIYTSLKNLDKKMKNQIININRKNNKILWIKEDNYSKINQNYKEKRILKEIILENFKTKYVENIIIEDVSLYNEMKEYYNSIYTQYNKKIEKLKLEKDLDEDILNKIKFINIINLKKYNNSLNNNYINENKITDKITNKEKNNVINILYFLNLKYTKEMDRTFNITKKLNNKYIFKTKKIKMHVNIIGYAKEHEILELKGKIKTQNLENVISIYDLKIYKNIKEIFENTDIFVNYDEENKKSVEILNIYNNMIKNNKNILVIEENIIEEISKYKNLEISKNNEIDINKKLFKIIKDVINDKEKNVKNKINFFVKTEENELKNKSEYENTLILKKVKEILFLD